MLDQFTASTPSLGLRTPIQTDSDNQAFPGENWFFYWKLGSSLWKSKLEEYTQPGPLLVPINWSFHTETGKGFDFADRRPETNLKKLMNDAHQVGRTLSFLLPLTPAPFLPNGGIPHLATGSLAYDSRSIVYGIVDADHNINKLYSFFDTRVFQAYAQFTRELGSYFIRSGIDAPVWGMECGHRDKDGFKSFLWDTSPTWQKSFEKFVRAHRQESPDSSLTGIQLSREFFQLIRQTYRQQASKDMSANWEGVLKVGFLGGHPQSIFEKLEENNSPHNYLKQSLETLTIADLPSTVLIPPQQKKGSWGKMLDDIVINGAIKQLQPNTASLKWDNILSPLRFFEIHHSPPPSTRSIPNWQQIMLKDYLQTLYRWTYNETTESSIQEKERESEIDNQYIHFFQGYDLNIEKFRQMVRLLMNGCHLILDKSGISEECSQQLELFCLENDLPIENINFHTNIRHIRLEHTRFIIFEGSQLAELHPEKIQNFWHRLIGVFSLNHLEIPYISGIEYYWRTRLPSPEELNYEEIRRLGIYNTASTKRKIDIPLRSNFKLLRMIDQIHVNTRSSSRQITLELGPNGSLSLDFGVFS